MRWLAFHIGWALCAMASAQQLTVSADKPDILIGERVLIQVCFVDTGAPVSWPETQYDGWELITAGEWKEVVAKDTHRSCRSFELTHFDTGIQVFRARWIRPLDTLTALAEIAVRTIAVDTTSDFKDIKGPMRAQYIPVWVWWCLGGLALLGLMMAALVWWRRRPKPVIDKPEPELSPYDWAMGRLREIESASVWKQGQVKLYYVEVSDTLRRYIELRWGLAAMEETTAIVLRELTHRGQVLGVDSLSMVLKTADQVKFARFTPMEQTHQHALAAAKDYVERTREVTSLQTESHE